MVRDTAVYRPLRELAHCNTRCKPRLKDLARQLLGLQIQQGEHDSVTDARVALRIYLLYQKRWERDVRKAQVLYGEGGLFGDVLDMTETGWGST